MPAPLTAPPFDGLADKVMSYVVVGLPITTLPFTLEASRVPPWILDNTMFSNSRGKIPSVSPNVIWNVMISPSLPGMLVPGIE